MSLAAALHAALLVIPPSRQSLGSEPDERVVVRPFSLAPFEEPPPSITEEAVRGGGTGEPVAALTEPPVLPRPDSFLIAAPPIPNPSRDVTASRIPVNPGPLGPGELKLGGPAAGPIGKEFLDHEPRARARISPDYPYEAKSRGLEGTVEVAFVVGPDGTVQGAHVVRADHRELESAAVRAVMQWRFEPGRYRGRPVAFRMTVPMVFQIAED